MYVSSINTIKNNYSIVQFKQKLTSLANLTVKVKNHKPQLNSKKHQINLTLSTSLLQVNR